MNEVAFNASGLPVPPLETSRQSGNLMLMEIPTDFQRIKQHDFSLASRWREHSRILFEAFFRDGFLVSDFVSQIDEDNRRSFYLLVHQDS